MHERVAVVTGGSSGIGAASARALAGDGWHVVVAARRQDLVDAVAKETGGRAVVLDVTDPDSVTALATSLQRCDLLVNNAGGARGLEPIAEADEAHWRWMYETNVMGTLAVTKALLPLLRDSGAGTVINVVSIAGYQPYPGGAGYNAAKHAQSALTQVLRQELIGQPIRVTELDPGMVETDFSLVRFDGDAARAAAVYQGVQALSAGDVAECVRWVAGLPAHVNIDRMTVQPRDQVSAQVVYRR